MLDMGFEPQIRRIIEETRGASGSHRFHFAAELVVCFRVYHSK